MRCMVERLLNRFALDRFALARSKWSRTVTRPELFENDVDGAVGREQGGGVDAVELALLRYGHEGLCPLCGD